MLETDCHQHVGVPEVDCIFPTFFMFKNSGFQTQFSHFVFKHSDFIQFLHFMLNNSGFKFTFYIISNSSFKFHFE